MRNAYRVWTENLKEQYHFLDPMQLAIETDFEEIICSRVWAGFVWLRM
jgi:hypothetical protein